MSIRTKSIKSCNLLLSALIALLFYGCAAEAPDTEGESESAIEDATPAPDDAEDPDVAQHSDELSVRWFCAGPHALKCGRGYFCDSLGKDQCPDKKHYGICQRRPQFCPKIFKPVCGCNGKTYGNACEARAAGVPVASEGVCKKPTPTGPFCGGIAGIRCPGGGVCLDIPNDGCDPNHGGADCGGYCSCPKQGHCAYGYHWDASPKVCGCVKDACPTNPCAAALCLTGTQCVVRDCKAYCEPIRKY